MGGTLFGGPYLKKGSYYLGYYIRVPYFRKLPDGGLFTDKDIAWSTRRPIEAARTFEDLFNSSCAEGIAITQRLQYPLRNIH